MTTAGSNLSPRPPLPERLLPLLYRRASLTAYRRSVRFALHRARVGPDATLPVPPLVDVLAVYLSHCLPPWFIARYGTSGVFRAAKILALMLSGFDWGARSAFLLARLVWRGLKRTTQSPSVDACYVRRAPVGNSSTSLGGCMRFRGFECADDALLCYWQRMRPVRGPCRILVRLHPALPNGVPDDLLAKDHDPVHPVPDWPPGYACCDRVSLADLAPGDYYVEVGLLDRISLQPLRSDEDGRAFIDLGWVRVAGTPPAVLERRAVGAMHAGA